MFDQEITMVSNNRETIDGVRDYLQRAGAQVATTARLDDAGAGSSSSALLLFADDFPREEALKAFAELRRQNASRLIVVVTQEVEAFMPATHRECGSSRVVVLRRPAWGWMILDAMRAGGGESLSE